MLKEKKRKRERERESERERERERMLKEKKRYGSKNTNHTMITYQKESFLIFY